MTHAAFDQSTRALSATEAIGLTFPRLQTWGRDNLTFLNLKGMILSHDERLMQVPHSIVERALEMTQRLKDFTEWRRELGTTIGTLGAGPAATRPIPCLVLRPSESALSLIEVVNSKALAEALVVVAINPIQFCKNQTPQSLIQAFADANRTGSDEPVLKLFNDQDTDLVPEFRPSPICLHGIAGFLVPTALLTEGVRARLQASPKDKPEYFKISDSDFTARSAHTTKQAVGNEELSFLVFPNRRTWRGDKPDMQGKSPGQLAQEMIDAHGGAIPPLNRRSPIANDDGKLYVKSPIDLARLRF